MRVETFDALRNQGLIELASSWSQIEGSALFEFIFSHSPRSKSQLGQDIIALFVKSIVSGNGDKEKGFFVEFGATNGVNLSNTLMLEEDFQWSGILCEPAKVWHDDLKNNRKSQLDFRCVYQISGQKVFFSEDDNAELSGIELLLQDDQHSGSRQTRMRYEVETVSLNDLLLSYGAPTNIDFISIDTEGSEYLILKSFDFSRWNISFFAIEHNHTENEAKLDALMEKNGYVRIFKSESKWDAWYVPKMIEEEINALKIY